MGTGQATYTLDNTWEKAHRRLTLLESVFDPWTFPRLSALGVGDGWRCLELGAGAGSVTRWLCERVGPAGRVTAVDLEPRFLEADPRPNLEILRRDVVAEGIPGQGWDLIHTRALLMHLPGRDALVAELVGRLRPGGVLVLEEADGSPMTGADSALYAEAWDRCLAVAVKAGGDWTWARRLPAVVASAGLAEVRAVVEAEIVPGGTPWAELVAMTWEQLAPLLLAEGLTADRIAAATAELSDPARWFPTCAVVAVTGRRPDGRARGSLAARGR